MLLVLLALSAGATRAPDHDTPIRVKLSSSGNYSPGDRAKVKVKAAKAGYLLVLRMETDGTPRILFPLDPRDDGQVDGGVEFEVRGRGDREAFAVGGRDGGGVVLAAWSSRPFRIEEWVRSGRWDLPGADDSTAARDPEMVLVKLIDRVVDDQFEYDVLPYTVAPVTAARMVGFYDPWFGYGYWGPRWYGWRTGFIVGGRGGGRGGRGHH